MYYIVDLYSPWDYKDTLKMHFLVLTAAKALSTSLGGEFQASASMAYTNHSVANPSTSKRVRKAAVGVMLLSFAILVFTFRWYHTVEKCRMNNAYIKEVNACATEMMKMMKHLRDKNPERRWWVDFGTLLALERKTPPMPWDHDSDYSLLIRDEADKDKFVREVKEYNAKRPSEHQFKKIALHKNNQVLQLGHLGTAVGGFRVDIFFFRRHIDSKGNKLIRNFHHACDGCIRLEQQVLPVKVKVHLIIRWCVLPVLTG